MKRPTLRQRLGETEQRVEREVALRRQAEEELRLLAEVTPGVVFQRTHEPDPRFLFLNDEIELLTGQPREDFLAGKIRFVELLHPEDAPWIPEEIDQALAERQRYQLIYRLRHLSGEWRWVEEFGIGVFHDERFAFLQGHMRDITERRRIAELMLENRQQYRLLFDHSPAGIVYYDRRLRVTECNDRFAALLQASKERLLDAGMTETETRELLPVLRGALEGQEGSWEGLYRYAPDAPGIWISLRAAPVYAESGHVRGGMAIVEDISQRKWAEEERRKLEAQVQHAQKLESLGVLAGGIAHDFNNLLMGIMGNADLALLKLPPDSPVRAKIHGIMSSARHAAELAKQMLAYSGRGQFVIEPIDLSQTVTEMAHLWEVTISKKAKMVFDLAAELPPVEADATQMRQVVMNLITNAAEAIGDRAGTVTVTTSTSWCTPSELSDASFGERLKEGDYVVLEVADTGCGMDADTQSRMFEPFFTTKFTGRGLGLSAVAGIVRGHRGAITVSSEPGKGTRIRVLFPARAGRALAAAAPAATTSTGGGGTVLVVDDEADVRNVAAEMLTSLGCSVVVATNGREAVEVFRARGADISLVLLDMAMPEMNGEETFRELRRLRADARVILCSGYSEQETTARVAGEGLAGFLQKPYELAALQEKVRASLGR